ncbi:MAG: polysaccharide pyruvyl transferase family protein [Proteobacteria bacterium]|nr:polysaccharide pyruvyl transferase family protein [Pseudomonadota bacterium]
MSHPNVGDVASSLIVSKLLKRDVLVFGPEPLHAPNLLGIGSILNWADANSVVWGSGCIAVDALPQAKPRAVVAARGPLTCEQLQRIGVPAPVVLGDPGWLIGDVYPLPRSPEQNLIALIPHYADLTHPFVEEARRQGAVVISPLMPVQAFLDALTTAEVIISSSLHGVVFAHALGRPAAWIELSDRVIGGRFKFMDYFASVSLVGDAVPRVTTNDSLSSAAKRAVPAGHAVDLQGLREALSMAETMLASE